MKHPAFRQSLTALAHPISILAIVVVLLNDHVWRWFWPSWFTGKIGDAAWLIFAPFLLAAILAWLMPARIAQHDARVGRLAIIITGLVFSTTKTIPEFHALTVRAFETLFGWPASLRLDPTDLIALPALLIAWRIWQQAGRRSTSPLRLGWAALALGSLATIANQPPTYDYGITCLTEQNSALVAHAPQFTGRHDLRYSGLAAASEDGGLTWQSLTPSELRIEDCDVHTDQWLLADPSDNQIIYRFTPAGAIERSEDGGQSWHREIDVKPWSEAQVVNYERRWRAHEARESIGPLDALIHQPTGSVVVAMGYEGVLVRRTNGMWHWRGIGPYQREDLKQIGSVVQLLGGEMGLALLVGFLIAGALAPPARRASLADRLSTAAWLLWGITVMVFPPAIAYDVDAMVDIYQGVGHYLMLFSALIAIPWGLYGLVRAARQSLSALAAVGIIMTGSMFLFFAPYLLWSQGIVPLYGIATILGIALTIITVLVGERYLRRYFSMTAASAGGTTSSTVETDHGTPSGP